MGVDWVWVRPRAGVDPEVLRAAIQVEALWYQRKGLTYPDEFGHLPEPVAPESAPEFHTLVEQEGETTWRVKALILNTAVPPEWRLEAFRSHLPHEVPRLVERVRGHLAEVAAGRHREFFRAWHTFRVAREAVRMWGALRERAQASAGRTNAWARSEELAMVRERIEAVPTPVIPRAPLWGAPLPALEGERAAAVAAPLLELVREWNRRVPVAQRIWTLMPPPFETELAEAVSDDWLAGLLEWMEQAAERECGLALWG